MLSAGFSCPNRVDHLQLSATNFQVKTKQAFGKHGYYLTLISDVVYRVALMNHSWSKHPAQWKLQVAKSNEHLVERASASQCPLKVTFGGKLPPVTLPSISF